MRFSKSAVNILLLGVATIVSAVPIPQFTSSIELESRDDFQVDVPDIFEREFDEPALYRRTDSKEYNVALHISGEGTGREHWALHFHPAAAPTKENTHESAPGHLHIVEAVAVKGAGGVLQTDHKSIKGYDKSRQGDHHMILGSFPSHADAKKAATEVSNNIHCEHPSQNCVDWTEAAVRMLHRDGHINEEHKNAFMAHYDTHAATVRMNTDIAANQARVAEKTRGLGGLSMVPKFVKKLKNITGKK